MSQTMTQTEMVIDLLRRRGEQGLTPLDALDLIGSFRLGARIFDAKERLGPDEEIVTERATMPSGAVVARYVLRRKVLAQGAEQVTLGW